MVTIISVSQGDGHGAESVLEHLLRSWEFNKNRLLILSPKRSRILRVAQELHFPHLALDTVNDSIISNFKAVRKCYPHIKNSQLVHAWSARSFEIGWWLGRKLKIPVSGTMHDHPHASFHSKWRRYIIRYFARHLSKMVAVSNAVYKACIKENYYCSMEIIHNGLQDSTIMNKARQAKSVRIGFLGMYAPLKGFSIIERWILNTTNHNVCWHLYGEVADDLKESASRVVSDCPDFVNVRGKQSPDIIYSEIDLLVHTSSEFDSLPTVLIEAACAGIPVVAACLGGASEIVDDKETGFLFDPGSPEKGLHYLRLLIKDETVRNQMGLAARKKYTSYFNISKMVNEYYNLWENLSNK